VNNKKKLRKNGKFLHKICFRKNRFWFLAQLLNK